MNTPLFKTVLLAAAFGMTASFNLPAQTYTFTTIAGHAGLGSADGTNSTARFYQPAGLAFDGSGNLFATDTLNQTIRKLTPAGTNWVVTTLAGSATVSGSANGTNAVARFNNPSGITVDSAGTIFITDAGNSTIRKLAPAGADWVTTTIAGFPQFSGSDDGTNSSALFNNPFGVVTEAGGGLLVADTANNTIRKLSPSGTNWIVTTIAGDPFNPGTANGTNTVALFNSPIGVARIGTNIFVADNGSHIIRMVTPSGTNWITTTIAGFPNLSGSANGTNNGARFSGPVGIAADPAGNLFVSEYGNNTIRKLTPSGTNWIVTTIAGQAFTTGSVDGTNNTARFNHPFGLAADTNGNVFVADQGNNTIRKLTPSGTNWITTTIAGLAGGSGRVDGTNFVAQFGGMRHAAADAAGNVYVADTENYAIRKLAKVGSDWVVTTIAGNMGSPGNTDGTNKNSRFLFPYGLTIHNQTNLFVADSYNQAIRKITLEGTNWITTTIAGTKGVSGSTDGTNSAALFNGPFGLAAAPNGTLYVADTFSHTIRKISPDGTNWVVTTIAGQAGDAGAVNGTNNVARFFNPSGVAVDGAGNLLVLDSNSTVRKMTASGTNWIVTTIAGVANFSGSTDGTNQAALFGYCFGLALAPDGSLIVADSGNATIRKLTPSGTNWITTTIGGAVGVFDARDGVGTDARFPSPQGVTVDSAGNLFIFNYSSVVLGQPTAAPASNPILQIMLVGNQAVLYWPSSAASFNLETTSPLRPGATWTNLPGATLSGPSYYFTNSATSGAAFFRLRQP